MSFQGLTFKTCSCGGRIQQLNPTNKTKTICLRIVGCFGKTYDALGQAWPMTEGPSTFFLVLEALVPPSIRLRDYTRSRLRGKTV